MIFIYNLFQLKEKENIVKLFSGKLQIILIRYLMKSIEKKPSHQSGVNK